MSLSTPPFRPVTQSPLSPSESKTRDQQVTLSLEYLSLRTPRNPPHDREWDPGVGLEWGTFSVLDVCQLQPQDSGDWVDPGLTEPA